MIPNLSLRNIVAHSIRVSITLTLSLFVGAVWLRADSPGAAAPSTDSSEYGQGVRTTPWQTPDQERSGFHLPSNFEVRLFAAEPQIAKPLNMAFDARGRLWVTQSVEYPYPAKDDSEASDAVMVITDKDGDGAADDVTTFADKLNIPIGIIPYGDGCLCFSIPNILYLRDTDGDGKCDRRELVLGPFDTTRDTHGMINAMRDGGDGWIYACHGFNNQSDVAGRDGHSVQMHSGNTFRFRPDGSRVELVTQGQVNPFGMTEDDWGYRYSADCHSKPITQLIRGACYPSFGRPHDGLGFLPPTVNHLHGSTAICGILHFPPESPIEPLRNQLISGNVMTSRLNRNLLKFTGATAQGEELSDFMTSDDPWFRPVDIQLGPDGHIYVADFYNKIIGHYEVPLDHPGRDRRSGRIWQIRYVGSNTTASGTSDSNSLMDQLTSTNPTRRRLATHSEITNFDAVGKLLFDRHEPPYARVAAIRSLWLAGVLDPTILTRLCADSSARVRVEALRLVGEQLTATDRTRNVAIDALGDSNAHVVQAAAEALSRVGNERDIDVLFAALSNTDQADPVLQQTIRICLRNLYQDSSPDSEIWQRPPDAAFASIMLGVERSEMIDGLLHYLGDTPDAVNRDELLQHAARHATGETLARCVEIAKQITDGVDAQFQLLQSLADSLNARPGNVPLPLSDWASELVDAELARFDELSEQGTVVAWTADDDGQWPQQMRTLKTGASALLADSIGRGESYTGQLQSDPFPAPDQIRFWLAGHNGFPGKDDHHKNLVRLIDSVTGDVIHEAYPPRNDVAIPVRWDTSKLDGRLVRIECIDGDSANAYAWLAIGQFEPAWIQNLEHNQSLLRATQWIKRLGLTGKEQRLRSLLDTGNLSLLLRLDVAGAIASLRQQKEAAVLLQMMQQTNSNRDLVDQMISATLSAETDGLMELAQILAKQLSSTQQRDFALSWVKGGADAAMLMRMCQDGWISPTVLADVDVRQSLTPRLSPQQVNQLQALTDNVDGDANQRAILDRLQPLVLLPDGDLENGQRVFTKHCAACHQLRGVGTVVGPQLDGAVTRSIERILEDLVTPDQNVDKAFRTTSFLLDDGRVIVGLVRSENDREISLVDATGKVITIEPTTIEQRRDAGRSLMPSNFGEALSSDEIRDLLKFVRHPAK